MPSLRADYYSTSLALSKVSPMTAMRMLRKTIWTMNVERMKMSQTTVSSYYSLKFSRSNSPSDNMYWFMTASKNLIEKNSWNSLCSEKRPSFKIIRVFPKAMSKIKNKRKKRLMSLIVALMRRTYVEYFG